MTPLLSIIAVSYNAVEETGRFLQSLKHVDVPFNIIVIDNASPNARTRDVVRDGLKEASNLDECLYTNFVENDTNSGYAWACNYGSNLTTYTPYVAFLNCDTQFLPEAASRIVAHFEAHDDVAVVGPKTTDSKNRLTHAGIVSDGVRDHHRFWLHYDNGQADDVFDAPTVSGATYFVRRAAWDQLGACPTFSDMFPHASGAFLPTKHYYEETWFSYHARKHRWKVRYLGTAHMIHEWASSEPAASPKLLKHFQESKRMYVQACNAHGIDPHV